MIIYRIENDKSIGPYRCNGFGGIYAGLDTDKHNLKPSYYEDTVLHAVEKVRDIEDCRFGFISLEQLHKWFDDSDLLAMMDYGLFITCYDAATVVHSDHQCVFAVDSAELKWKKSLSIFLFDESLVA